MNIALIRYVLTASIRDRLLLSMLLVLVLGACLSLFLGSSAIIEQDRFTLVFAAGGLRIACALGLVLFIVFFMRRSFESRDVEFVLSRPVGRIAFVSAYAAAFSLIALVLAFASFAVVYAISPHLYSDGHMLWAFSLGVEYIIMANIALFFAMMLSSAATATMATLGFYILARMMGQILGINDSTKLNEAGFKILEYAVEGVSILIPRLDLFAQTSWLVYGAPETGIGYGFIALQGAFFVALVLTGALLDLVRREF